MSCKALRWNLQAPRSLLHFQCWNKLCKITIHFETKTGVKLDVSSKQKTLLWSEKNIFYLCLLNYPALVRIAIVIKSEFRNVFCTFKMRYLLQLLKYYFAWYLLKNFNEGYFWGQVFDVWQSEVSHNIWKWANFTDVMLAVMFRGDFGVFTVL